MPAAAIIGAAGSLLASGMSNMFAQNNADISYARQKELMALQQKYAVENWNREANYNDPKEQMKRLKEAGLNPNLVYSNGAAGLQAPSTAAPTAPSAPMASTIPFTNPGADAAQAALAMKQAKLAGSKTTEQDIRNKYLDKEINLALNNLRIKGELDTQQIENWKQAIKESQANIDALAARVDNETYDRFLSTLTSVSTIRLQSSQYDLNEEQKKWVGTHAMAALIGAQGAAAQANAIAEAVRMFRHPDELFACVKSYFAEIKKELGAIADKEPLKSLIQGLEDFNNGNYFDALFGRGSKQWVKDKVKGAKEFFKGSGQNIPTGPRF